MAHRETRTPLRLLLLSTVLLLLVLLSVEVQAQRVTIRFSSSSFSFEEEGGQHCFTLSATGLKDLLCTADVSVTVGLRNITFTATPFDALQGGGDFLLDGVFVSNNPKTVTFGPSDEISSDFCFLIVGDNAYEGDESFFVEILDVTGPACADELAVMDPPFVEIQIVDNDELLVNFTERRIIVNEGEDAVLSARSYVNPFSQALSIGIICFEPSSGNRLTPATLDVDYRLTEDTLRFTGVDEQPPVLSDTIVIRTIDDDFAEETESFICALRLTVNPTDPLQSTDPDTVTISIRDNDMLSISWLEPAYRFPEAGTIALVSLVASNRFTVNFTVSGQPEEVDTSQDFYVCNGTEYPLAKRNEDFLPAGSVAFEFSTVIRNRVSMNTFRLLDNDILEDDEVFVGNFQIPSIIGQQLKIEKKAPTVTCIVIEDDDYVQVNFTDTTIEVSESAGTVNVSFDLSGLHAIPLNVTVLCEEAAPASAMDGPDFLAASRVFSFPANSDVSPTLAGPLSISIINNEVLEAQESFVCRFVDPSHPRIILGPPVTITIVDEDSVTVRYNQSLYEVAEEDGSVSLRLVLEGDSDIPVCVQTSSFELDESSSRPRATATEDFAMETRSFTFQPGVKGWDFVVGLEDDVIPEGEEFFYGNVTLCDPEDADMVLIGEPSQPLVRITDADKFVSISLTSSSYSVIESGNAVEVCVSLNDTYGVDIAVSLQLSSSGDNAATAGVDLEMGPFDVTVAANTLQSCVNISITDDLVVEGNEVATVSLTYTDNQAGVSVGTPDMATVTIFDDDAIMWYFTNETYTVGEDDQTLLVTIRANGTASFPYNISVGVEDILTTFGADYSLVSFSTATATPSIANTLPHTITPGTDEVILTFMISDDEVFEGDEDFRVTLMVDMATVADGISAGTPDVATVTIADGDAMSCFFQPSAYNNSEGNTVDLMVACNRQFERSFNLTINTRDLAIDVSTRAVGGVDYEAFSGRVTLDANTQSGVVSVPLLHDDDYECNEQFEAFLQRSVDAPQGISVTDPATATVDIQDSTEVCVLVNSTDYTVIEGNVVTVGLRVDKKLSCPVHAVVTLMDGSAVAPEDYIHRQFNVTFNPGSLTAEVSIQTRPDNVGELDETFTLMIAPADGSERVSSCDPDQSTVTIIENTDCEVRFNPDEYGVNEGSVASLKLELSCEIAPGVECEVTVVTGNDTAHSPVDFQGGLYTVVFSGSNMATLNITTLVDSVTEGPERFRANILIPFSSAPKLTAGSPDQAIVDIHDSSMLEVFFSQSAYCVNESDPVGVVTVIASGVHQLNYTVNVGIRGLTATVFEDYSSLSVELKFQPGEVEKTFEIPIIDDMVIEDVEEVLLTIFVTKASLGVGVLPGEPSMARLQIVDDDCVTVQFAEVSQFVLEGVTAAIPLTAEYSGILNSTFNVTVRLSDGTATAPSDYGNDSPVYTAVFQPDSMVSTILVDVVEDNLAECIEDFTAFLMSSTRGKGVCVLIGQPDMTTVNILDGNDPIEVVIDPVTYSADEGEKVNITLRTNSSLYSFPFSVSLMFVDISATQGSDYFAQPTTVSFSPGEEQVSFEVTTVDDDIAELTEMFEIVLLNVTSSCGASPVVIGSEDTAQVEIVDRDVVKVFFDPDSYTVVEGSNALLIIKTDRDFSSPFEVAVMTMPGTATEGMDYEGGIYTATFQPGSQTANVSIPTLSDAILEPNEVFEGLLMVSSTTGDLKVEVSSPDVSNITITDSTTLTVRFDPAEYTVTEGGIANLTLVADKVFDVPFNVTVTLMGITATGGVDYKDSSPYTVSFKPGSMVAVLQVPILNDGIVETTETFDATISIPDSSRALGIQPGDPSVANVNIVDGDGVVTVTIDPTSLNVTEGERAKLTLIADKNFSFNFTVFLDTADIEAIDGEDYVGGEIAVVFTPGSLMVMVFIDTTDDQISELTETFSATIRVPDDEDLVAAGDPSSSVVTILDNDVVKVFFDPDSYTVVEGSNALLIIKTDREFSSPFEVAVMTMPGTATEGMDYEGGIYTATFQPGSQTANVSIRTLSDAILEPNEVFEGLLMVSSTTGDLKVEVSSPDISNVTIIDSSTLTVRFDPAEYTVTEGGIANLTLVADKVFDVPFNVTVTLMGITATGGVDYKDSSPYTVSFKPGSMVAVLQVPILNDGIVETTETFDATISIPDSSRALGIQPGDPSVANVNIVDGDGVVTVTIDPTSLNVTEGERAKLTLIADKNFSFNFTVFLDTSDIEAFDGEDYVGGEIAVVFTPGSMMAMVFINTTDDQISELTETFSATIRVPDDEDLVAAGDPSSSVVTILDNDVVKVFFDPDSYTVMEGSNALLIIKTDREFSSPFEVAVMTMPGTATEGMDYEGGIYTATFQPGSQTANVSIRTLSDAILEPNEVFEGLLMVSSTTGDLKVEVSSPDVSNITITDSTTLTVRFDPAEYTVTEGGIANLTLVADKVFDVPFNVTVTLMGITATGGVDYKDSSPYTVSFKPGSMVAVLQVPILNDGIVETTETFDATISIPDSSRALGIQPGDPSVANVNIVDGDGVVTVTIDPTSLNVTEGERAKLTLIADKNFSFNFTVFLDTADIEAIDGEDYVGGEIAVVFTPGSLMAMVFINTTDDQISELTETFSATIRVPDDEDLVAAGDPSSSVVTILDNDGVCVYVEPTDYSLLEGTVANFTLRMNTTQYLFDCAVTLRSVDGSAIAGDDYQGGPYTVMFSQGQEMASVSIATFHDSSAEGNEIFFVQLDKSCGDHVTFCSDDQGRVVIVDDDSLNVFFQPDSYEVVEGGVATITIATSSQDYDFEFTVVLRYRNGTAQEFFDFFPETTSVTFSPGQSNATFEVPTPEDALSELTEEYYVDIVSVSMPDLVGISDPSTATVSILDNEEAIEVIFDPIAYSVDEGGKVNVTLRTSSNFYSFPFSVSLMFMDISATQGSDYVAQPTTVSFSPGEGQVSFEVTTVDDDVAELTEMFKIVIVNTNQSQLVVPGSADVATVEIADDDEPVELTISSMNVTESTGFVVVCVDKDRPSANPITLDIDPQQLVAGSSPDQGGDLLMAQGGVDFDSSTVSITIPANSTHECVNITITDDSLVECDEIFNVSMAIDSNVDQFAAAEFSLVVSETLITIIDDDTITVMFEEPMYMVTEGEGPLMVRLVSTGNTSFDFNIDVNLEPPVRMGRNALPGEDFVKNESLAFFVAGGDSGEITIFVLEDEIFESNETFSMSLSVPEEFQSKRIFVGALNVTVVLIKDNDVATVVFNPIMYNTPEGSKVEVCLEVDRDIEQPFTAVVNSKNGTAIGKLDYDEGVFFAEFMPGSRTSCFFVVTMNDSIVEVPEDFQLIITTVGPDNVGVVIGQDDVATVIIIDTTVEVPVRFEFDRYNVTEAEEEVSVALVTDIDHQFDFTVTVIVRDGTAERPADFTSADEIQVVFPAGVNRVELPISVINDNLAEPTEDFHLDLVVPEEAGLAGVISIAPNTTTVDVLDDDVVELTFELPDYIIKENEGPLIVRINASGPSAIPYTITITPQPNTAQADSDFDPTPITVTINPGETSASVTIPITDDSVVEVTEQFRLVMTVEDDMGDMKVVPGQPSTVTVQDNDVLVSFSQPEYRVTTKDLFAMIGINASGDLSQAFTVTGILEDGTAIEGVDYEGKTFEVKFGPGVTMQTFNVRIRSGKNRTEDIFFFGNITEVDRDRVSIGEPSRTKIFILDLSGSSSQEGAINDSVIGDPLFTIPLPTTVSTDEFLKEQVSLCFEFHGSANKQYSLISDQCTFANAHYAPASADPTLHIISEIGIRTEGANLSCHDVHVQMEGCQVTLDGRPFSGRYQANGITLNTMRNRVRISTDNCITGRSLVMWVVCDQLTEIHHLRFIVSRGSSIRPIGHGLIGQFWNIPVDLVPYHGPYGNFNTVPNDIQAYNLTFKPVGKPPRSVIAELAEKTWDNTKTPCLYAGDGMGGPIFEAPPEFGSVIEDVPDSYEVASLFEHNFKFSKFVVKC